jgi:prepilin-type N-terminal cleavage/methylation domain-containing protein/prepilin-type processing-associated H-X9-DG protein
MKRYRHLRIGLRRPVRNPGFTVMEVMVALAIVLVLLVIAFPVYKLMRQRSGKQAALKAMKELGSGLNTYTAQHAGVLPAEDASGTDSWKNAAKPEANEAWYNALPRLLGKKGVGDFADSPRDFYTSQNMLYLPGAAYPDSDKVLREPLFAIAFNTKLQRRDADGRKKPTKQSDITNPARTVAFLEQGLPDENRTLTVQTKKDYDGSCKGSAKSFVGRYGGQGALLFIDGHVEMVDARNLLTETGSFPFPQSSVIWTCTPEENPNKASTGQNITAK